MSLSTDPSSSSSSSLFIQAPLGTSTSAGSCRLTYWQICWITALLCFTAISVKSAASSRWCFVLYCWLSCVSCPPPGHHGGEEVVWLGHHPLACLVALIDPHTYIISICYLSVNATCKLWFCCFILHMRPRRGISPPWLLLKFLP